MCVYVCVYLRVYVTLNMMESSCSNLNQFLKVYRIDES